MKASETAHFKRPQCSDPLLTREKQTWNYSGGRFISCLEEARLRCARVSLRARPVLGGLAAKLIVVCGLGDFFEPHDDGSAITR
jgi:hypothetical protein